MSKMKSSLSNTFIKCDFSLGGIHDFCLPTDFVCDPDVLSEGVVKALGFDETNGLCKVGLPLCTDHFAFTIAFPGVFCETSCNVIGASFDVLNYNYAIGLSTKYTFFEHEGYFTPCPEGEIRKLLQVRENSSDMDVELRDAPASNLHKQFFSNPMFLKELRLGIWRYLITSLDDTPQMNIEGNKVSLCDDSYFYIENSNQARNLGYCRVERALGCPNSIFDPYLKLHVAVGTFSRGSGETVKSSDNKYLICTVGFPLCFQNGIHPNPNYSKRILEYNIIVDKAISMMNNPMIPNSSIGFIEQRNFALCETECDPLSMYRVYEGARHYIDKERIKQRTDLFVIHSLDMGSNCSKKSGVFNNSIGTYRHLAVLETSIIESEKISKDKINFLQNSFKLSLQQYWLKKGNFMVMTHFSKKKENIVKTN